MAELYGLRKGLGVVPPCMGEFCIRCICCCCCCMNIGLLGFIMAGLCCCCIWLFMLPWPDWDITVWELFDIDEDEEDGCMD